MQENSGNYRKSIQESGKALTLPGRFRCCDKIDAILLEIGMPVKLSGYAYTREAVCLVLDHPGKFPSMSRFLYPAIAERFNVSRTSVERCIRLTIETAWNRGNLDVLYAYFGNTVSPLSGRPTNKEFIATIANWLTDNCWN